MIYFKLFLIFVAAMIMIYFMLYIRQLRIIQREISELVVTRLFLISLFYDCGGNSIRHNCISLHRFRPHG